MARASTRTKQAKAKAKPAPKAKAVGKAKPSAKGKPAPKAKAAPKAKPGASLRGLRAVVRSVPRIVRSVATTMKKVVTSSTSSAPSRIAAGDKAPSFELKDQSGKVVSSASLGGKPYVLYFYPKDDTTGCTREACGFRDAMPAFGKRGARIIGVSPDSEASHAKFAGKYGLPFTLLSDPDKVLAKAYGAWGMKKNYGKEYMGIIRSTFVVDGAGKVKRAYYGVKVDGHVDSVLGDVA
jgi:thioredoxin-dependent peroxiredoxin